MKYSQIKNAIQWLRQYGYRRTYGNAHYVKYWSSGYSSCSFMIDVYDLAMVNHSIEDYMEHLENKALKVLEEIDK